MEFAIYDDDPENNEYFQYMPVDFETTMSKLRSIKNIQDKINYLNNEIKDKGANVILALDNSGSMRNPRLAALKKAYPVFTESLLGENANDNNVVCSLIMPCSYRNEIEYLCTKSKDEMNNFLSLFPDHFPFSKYNYHNTTVVNGDW